MGWFGKIIGGSLGFVVGGPVGAAVGASLGAFADSSTDTEGEAEPTHELQAEAEFIEDEIGSYYSFVIHSAIPRNAAALFTLRTKNDNLVKAVPGFCDDDGDYFGYAPIVDGRCAVYVPHTALLLKGKSRTLTLVMTVVSTQKEEMTLFARSLFQFRATRLGPFSKVALLRPLIDICMAVAHADGMLESSEVRAIKSLLVEQLGIPGEELTELRDAMKAPVVEDLGEAVAKSLVRLPGLTREDLLSFASHVAHADGRVSPEEFAVIRQIAGDVTPRQWEEIAAALELTTVDHHAVLGVPPDASAADIKRAYRAKILQYHPDRVSMLPAEFQKLAQEKTIELRTAYETLLAQAERRGG
jgi:DnaJ like chaperone protein